MPQDSDTTRCSTPSQDTPAPSVAPKLTQQMTLHLNGGNKFSELHYKILADGIETGITRHTRTDGSPRYRITGDVFRKGDDVFDVVATKGIGMTAWIRERAAVPQPERVSPGDTQNTDPLPQTTPPAQSAES